MGLPWMEREKWASVTSDLMNITNFDDNVIRYSKYGKPNRKISSKKIDLCTQRIAKPLDIVRRLSKYAGYLVITLPEFLGLNLEVVRVVIPELITLSLPSFPPRFHPRFNISGGVINNEPHPLA
jgi:hypothetical protein